MANIAVDTVEHWVDDGAWRFSGPRSIAAGVLVLDAGASGPVSTHLYYRDPLSASTPVGKATAFQCLEFTVTTTGSFRFGVNKVPGILNNNVKLIEFVLNGSQVDFFMRGTVPTGFGGTLSIPTTTMRLRMAIQEDSVYSHYQVRYALCSSTGSVVVDSGWLSAVYDYPTPPYYIQYRGTQATPSGSNSNYATINPVGSGGYGGLTNASQALGHLYNAVATQTFDRPSILSPSFVSLTGVTTVQPWLSIVNVTSAEVDTFMTGGSSSMTTLAVTPTTPTVAITTHSPGLSTVVISTVSANCAIWAVVDEGAYGVDAVSVATNKRVLTSIAGASLSLTVSDPSTIRAVAYNGKLSGVVTQYVGPTTPVPVPEIAPRAGSIIAGTSMPVRIYCADPTATIRYTTDGTDPTSSSAVYTGPLFMRDVTRLRVAAFGTSGISLVKNAFFWLATPTSNSSALTLETNVGVPWEPIPDLKKAASWNANANATFDETAGTIVVNDPSGYGVSVRADLLPYQSGATTVVRFVAQGRLQLQVPGQSLYFVWDGTHVGWVTTPTATPTTSLGASAQLQVSMEFMGISWIVLAGNRQNLQGLIRVTCVHVVGLDSTGTQTGASAVLVDAAVASMYTAPTATWSTPVPACLNFTGIGIASYTISGVEAAVTKALNPVSYGFDALNFSAAKKLRQAAYPWVIPQRAVFTLPNGSNVAGVSVSAATSDGSTVTMLAASATGETRPTTSFASVSATGYTPLATDAVTRVQLLALTQQGGNGFIRLTTAAGHGSRPTSELGEWNIARQCSDNEIADCLPMIVAAPLEFRRDSPGWISANNIPQLALPQNSLRAFHDTVLTYPYQDLDTGSAWFRIRFEPGFSLYYGYEQLSDSKCDSFLTCGWDVDRNTFASVTKIVSLDTGAVCTLRSDLRPEASAYAYIQSMNTATWTAVPDTQKLPVVAMEKHIWYCGRKVSGGHLFVRTVVLPETDMTNTLFDTGWVDTGTVPAALPRPRIIYRTRVSPQGSLRGEHTGKCFVRGWQNLSDTQLDNCFAYGTPTPLPAPVITDAAGGSADISTYPAGSTPESSNMVPMVWDPAANSGASALYVHAGNSALRRRISTNAIPGHEGLLTSSGTLSISTVSTVHAVNLGDPIPQASTVSWDSVSPAQVYNFTHQTTDYISIQATLPRHVILQFDKTAVLPVTTGTAYWKIVFSDGWEQTISSQLTDDVERVLDAGSYTVKFVRVALNNSVTSNVGETIPASFTVSDHIELTTTAPTTVMRNTATAFQASTTTSGVSYRWEFSDGFVADTATVSRTMTKSGRYTWTLVVVDDLGDSAQAEGKFVVPWTTGTLTPPVSLSLGDTGVKIS